MAVEREVLVERTPTLFEGMKISWGGIFGGVLAGIGTLMLLSSLGIAIGISAVDPRDPSASSIGTGAAIWTSLSANRTVRGRLGLHPPEHDVGTNHRPI